MLGDSTTTMETPASMQTKTRVFSVLKLNLKLHINSACKWYFFSHSSDYHTLQFMSLDAPVETCSAFLFSLGHRNFRVNPCEKKTPRSMRHTQTSFQPDERKKNKRQGTVGAQVPSPSRNWSGCTCVETKRGKIPPRKLNRATFALTACRNHTRTSRGKKPQSETKISA
jgi:hypothetical protein